MKRLTKDQRSGLAVLAGWTTTKTPLNLPQSTLVENALAVIDSQAAEIRDLKARLAYLKKQYGYAFSGFQPEWSEWSRINDATDLRKPFKPEGET